MSENIDERVVAMNFDNGNFKKNAADTITTLDKLKQNLNMDAAKKSLDDLSESGKRFSLQGIGAGIEGIADKFKMLSIVGITALVNIANKAVDAGLQVAKSLTIDPIKAGLDEYELKLGSIQTILANTSAAGTNLADVSGALNDLNTYADKTIYNFGAMTKNIGLFTNAGIGIVDATSMIKGFSNAAAASGTSAEGAAGAAYQLSQALSAGTIRLMDWKSLTNAGMGNKNMQNGLIDIAGAMGMLNKNTTDSKTIQGNFNASLEKNWLSADVMSNFLKIMAGDMTDAEMAQLGLTKAQIKSFKAQQKIAEEAATKVRTATQLMGTLKEAVGSSWSQTFELFIGDFNEATDLWTNVNNRLSGMIQASGDARNNLVQGWKELGGRDVLIDGLTNAFDALLGIIKPIKEAFQDIFPPVTVGQLIVMTRKFKEFTENLKIGEETADKVKRVFKGVFAVFDIGIQIVKGIFGVFKGLFSQASAGAGGFLDFAAKIGDWLVRVDEAVKKGDALKNFFATLAAVIQWPIDKIKEAVAWFKTLFTTKLDLSGFSAFFNLFGERMQPLIDLLKKGRDMIKNFLSGGGDAKPKGDNPIIKFINGLSKALLNAVKSIDYNHIFDALNTGLLIGIILLVRKLMKIDIIDKFFGGIVGTAKGGFMRVINSISGVFGQLTSNLKAMQNQIKAKTLLMIAGAVALLAASAVALSMVDSKKLAGALGAITIMMGDLMASLKILESGTGTKGMAKLPLLTASLILFAIAIDLLTISVVRLSKLDWESLARGLTGVTVLITTLVAASQLLSKNPTGMMAGAAAMVVMAGAIGLLTISVKTLADLSWAELLRGLTGIVVVMGALIATSKLMSGGKDSLIKAAIFFALAKTVLTLALAVKLLSGIDPSQMVQGLAAMGTILGMLIIFSKTTGNAKGLGASAVGMLLIAAAMKILVVVVQQFATMSWEEMGRGLAGMAGALVGIAVAMQLMPKNMLITAASLAIVAYSLGLIAKVMVIFGGFNWTQIAKAMVTLAGSLAIIAGAMYLMTGALPGAIALIIVAGALTLLVPVLQALGAMAWGDIVKGLVALVGVFLVLGVSALILAPVVPIILALGIAIGLLGIGLMAVGAAVLLFALGMTALAALGATGAAALTLVITAILALIPLAMQKLGEGIVAFAKVISESGPTFVAAMTTLLTSILMTVNKMAPQIASTFLMLITLLIETLVKAVPKFVDGGMRIVTGILNGIAKNIGKLMDAAANLIVKFLEGMGRNLPKILKAGAQLVIDFMNGIADTIRTKAADFRKAGWNIASAIIEGMTGGLTDGIKKVVNVAKNIGKAALDGVKGILGINSPSKEFGWVADMSVLGLVNTFNTSTKKVYDAAGIVGDSALQGVKDSMSGLPDAINTNLDLQPKITPVLDLTEMKKGAAEASTLMKSPTLDLGGVVSKATSAGTGYQANKDLAAAAATSTDAPLIKQEFNQYNTSPKTLGDAEIYRQTKNLISAAKGALDTNA